MIIGVNKVFEHNSREYHIQCEDLDVQQASFEIRVYDGGTVLWRKKVPYADIVAKGLPRIEMEEALRHMMEKTIITVEAAIAKGKLG